MDQQTPPNKPPALNADVKQVKEQHMFDIKTKKPAAPVGPDPAIMEEISQVHRRLKLLETTISNMRSKLQNLENNEVETSRDSRRDIKALEEENDELKSNVRELKEHLRLVMHELQDAAKDEEVKVIKGYLDLWNPVNFVTMNQSRKIAKDVFDSLMNK